MKKLMKKTSGLHNLSQDNVLVIRGGGVIIVNRAAIFFLQNSVGLDGPATL